MAKRRRRSHSNKQPAKLFNVVVSDDYLDRIPEVAERLRSAGMRVGRIIPSIGTIEGVVDSTDEQELKGIEGVEAVEEQRSYQLPPPESDLQ